MTLLEEVLAAHGGRHALDGVQAITARFDAAGALFAMRGVTPVRDGSVTVEVARPAASFDEAGRPGRRGRFEAHRVWVEGFAGEVLGERADPRAAFRRSARRQARWDELDFVYFAGYAWWNYLLIPWLLGREDVAVREGRGRTLLAEFPAAVPTHSRRQRFHVGEDGRITRHDYTAEVVAPWAVAAHLWDDHREVEGIVLPFRRRVWPRVAGRVAARLPVLVALDIHEVRIMR